MPKSFNQKQKLLYLAQYLLRETDEDHPVTVAKLISYLESVGISAERKSLYDDLEQLTVFGLDVIHRPGKYGGYFIGGRRFELSEVKLLVDAVQSSRFLTRKKSEELISKLQTLASRHEGASLAHTVFVANRIKNMNESIYINVNAVSTAIEKDEKIRFQYFEWSSGGQKKLRRDGASYVVSPFHLIWDDENYYLVGVEEESGEKRHFRVDKMLSIKRLDERRAGKEIFEDFDFASYEKKLFGMFNGREERVTVRCADEVAGVFFDRFGSDLVTRTTPGGFETTLSVVVSPLFYSWLMGFGNKVKILSPQSVQDDFCKLARSVLENYSEK